MSTDFVSALAGYRQALEAHMTAIATEQINADYYRTGRQARRCLRRVYQIAALHRMVWTPGQQGARSFY